MTDVKTTSSHLGWQAGIARCIMTPETPVWLAGYAQKRVPEGKIHDLWIKIMALEDEAGKQVILVCSDHMGMSHSVYEDIVSRVQATYGIDRADFMLTFTHNHAGPRLRDDLVDYFPDDAEQERLVDEYSDWMSTRLVTTVGKALADLRPAQLELGDGHCTFAVNRRENKGPEIADMLARGEKPKGVHDFSVPVMAVRDTETNALRATIFGYACHPTTLCGKEWCGDYPGFAQEELEKKHQGTTAMFINTCGADFHPHPRSKTEYAAQQGLELATAVSKVLDAEMLPVAPGSLETAFARVELDFDELVTEERLQTAIEDKAEYRARWARRMLVKLQAGEELPTAYQYPVQVWRLGPDFRLIGLGGEAVIDYALRFKEEFGPGTWVSGDTNECVAYIPSRRVWEEGGYEGGPHLDEYGHPAWRWAGDVEDRIVETVHRLMQS